MADDIAITAGSGTNVATDDCTSGHVQLMKLAYSADGNRTHISADANGLLVNLGANNDVVVSGSVDLGATDNAVLDAIDSNTDYGSVVGNGTAAGSLRVTLASDTTGVVAVTDNGGSITVDGTVAATQSGTWNVTDISGTVSLPTGAATSANQATEITALQLIDNPVVAHDAPVSGATGSYMLGINARSTEPAVVADADASYLLGTILGKAVTQPYAIPASTWSYAAASGGITNTTGVTAKAAAGANVRNYVTRAQVINGHASTSTDVQIRDGAAGTVLWRGFAQAAGGGVSCVFDPPLRGTANTLIEIACGTTGSATYFNLQGFTAAE